MNAGSLDPGSYTAHVWATGDGTYYCDSDRSSSCSFTVACQTLSTPSMTGIGGASCGGSTTESSPVLSWRNLDNESGFRWEVRSAEGAVVASGSVGADVTSVNVGALSPDSYSARVQAVGDGASHCDSEWSGTCSFTVKAATTVDFTWWPAVPKEGERVRFADLSSPDPEGWLWSFDDGMTSGERHPTHVFGSAGSFDVELQAQLGSGQGSAQKRLEVVGAVRCGDGACEGSETAWSCAADCALEPEETGRTGGSDLRPTVPAAVGGVEGVAGTFWMTEGGVFNPGAESVQIVMEYTPVGGTKVLETGPFEVEPERSLHWDNIVEELFGTKGNGGLWLDATGPALFLTRSYNQAEKGTFGQGVSGMRERMTLGRGDGELYLTGLREDERFRTNLYFQEVDGSPVMLRIDVYDGSGKKVGSATAEVGGHSEKLLTARTLGVGSVGSAYARVSVVGGEGRVAMIGSVADNVTGDPTTIDALHAGQVMAKAPAGESHDLVAVVAHTEGLLGSVWRSRVTVVNPAAVAQTARLEYAVEYDRTGAMGVDRLAKSATIDPGEQVSWDDVLVDLFRVPENAKTQGALHVYAPEGLMIQSRTYNQQPGGATFGQELKALKAGDMIREGEIGAIVGLRHGAETRTNLGLAEFSGRETTVEVSFYTTLSPKTCLGTLPDVVVPAYAHLQLTKVFERLGLPNTPINEVVAYVEVKRGGSIYAYASVADNSTGDATTYWTTKK